MRRSQKIDDKSANTLEHAAETIEERHRYLQRERPKG